jgi:hypothetical protein
MPVSLPVTSSSMNYASVVFAGFAAISIIWYIVYARKHFTGPPASAEEVRAQPVMTGKAVVDAENAYSDESMSTKKVEQ